MAPSDATEKIRNIGAQLQSILYTTAQCISVCHPATSPFPYVTMWNLMISHTPSQGDWVPLLPNFGFSELFSIGGSSWKYFGRIKVFWLSSVSETVFLLQILPVIAIRIYVFLPRDVMRKCGLCCRSVSVHPSLSLMFMHCILTPELNYFLGPVVTSS